MRIISTVVTMLCGQGLHGTGTAERMASSLRSDVDPSHMERTPTRNGSRNRGHHAIFRVHPVSLDRPPQSSAFRSAASAASGILWGVSRRGVLCGSERRKTLFVPDIRELPAGEPYRALIARESLPRCSGSLRDDSRS